MYIFHSTIFDIIMFNIFNVRLFHCRLFELQYNYYAIFLMCDFFIFEFLNATFLSSTFCFRLYHSKPTFSKRLMLFMTIVTVVVVCTLKSEPIFDICNSQVLCYKNDIMYPCSDICGKKIAILCS